MSRNYFQPLMGRRIDAITSDAIQREVSALAESGLSPKTIGNAHALFVSVMRQYWSDYTDHVTLPQKQKYEQRAVTADEIKLILLAVKGTEIELPVLCGLWLGMRMSEIRGAMVEDVEGNILHIRRAIVDAENGEPVVKGTKTTAGARDLPLPEYILGLLPEEGYFTRLSGQSIYKRFSRLCEQKGIRHLRFHDLRHANAAIMVRLGIDSKYAQERNGWTTDYMYRQQYAYIMGDKMQQVTKQIDDYFSHELLTK